MDEKLVADPTSLLTGGPDERRAAAQRAEKERALARRRALDSQAAADIAPHERIRIWERLHGLSLPRSAAHPLLAVVVAQTKLTLRDVVDEQQRRRALGEGRASQEGS